MPCYVITRTRFREMGQFHTFRSRLAELASDRRLRLLSLEDGTLPARDPDDQAVMLEFNDAETACAFMCSPAYREIARPPEA